MSTRTPIRAGGVVLLRETQNGRQTLLVHRPRHMDWSLPKGKTNSGETIVASAVRECQEETGIRPILGPSLGRQSYAVMGRPKTVDYWRATVGQDHGFEPNDEVDKIRWVSQGRARRLLTYKRDIKFMNAAFELPETIALIVVRHGAAIKRNAFTGDDRDRSLNARGETQSQRLISILDAYGAGKIFSSPTKRCLDTVEPYATASGVKIRREVAFGEESYKMDPIAATRRATALLRNKSAVVICSHRPVLPGIFASLIKLAGFRKELVKTPLRPASLIVAHRARVNGKWAVVGTERHES